MIFWSARSAYRINYYQVPIKGREEGRCDSCEGNDWDDYDKNVRISQNLERSRVDSFDEVAIIADLVKVEALVDEVGHEAEADEGEDAAPFASGHSLLLLINGGSDCLALGAKIVDRYRCVDEGWDYHRWQLVVEIGLVGLILHGELRLRLVDGWVIGLSCESPFVDEIICDDLVHLVPALLQLVGLHGRRIKPHLPLDISFVGIELAVVDVHAPLGVGDSKGEVGRVRVVHCEIILKGIYAILY